MSHWCILEIFKGSYLLCAIQIRSRHTSESTCKAAVTKTQEYVSMFLRYGCEYRLRLVTTAFVTQYRCIVDGPDIFQHLSF